LSLIWEIYIVKIRQQEIMSYILELLSSADKKFLEKIDTGNELIKELRNELFFIGDFTESDLEDNVIPFLQENIVEIYKKKDDILGR